MKNIFFIQEIESKKFYGNYRGSMYLTGDINDAMRFNNKRHAISEMLDFNEVLSDKLFEIKEFITLEE